MRIFHKLVDRLRERARATKLSPTLALARLGEDVAYRYLQRNGYLVVARNFTTLSGLFELDLVAWEKGELVFVEVKTRSSDGFATPESRIDRDKIHNIMRAGQEYCRRSDNDFSKTRLDVVSVVMREGKPDVKLLRDVMHQRGVEGG